jgi:hypothetical protein
MKFLGPALTGRITFGFLSALILPGLLVAGCVSLTKPESVTRNCPTGSAPSCSDDPNQHLPPDDAKKDTVANPDQPYVEEAPIVKPDAGPDVSTPVPDSSPDKADAGTDSADVRTPADVADASPPPADVTAEKVTGAEPGPEPPAAEPGPEPSSGPEPGNEPGPEPGPELGKEPGAEPGSEPGPEPPPDAGSDIPDASSFACANATPLTGGNTGRFETVSAYCFVTCDSMQNGWGCSSFSSTTDPTDTTKRTLKVNGSPVACGSTLPAKTSGGYYYFELGAGGNVWDQLWWSGTAATSCKAPAGGFVP